MESSETTAGLLVVPSQDYRTNLSISSASLFRLATRLNLMRLPQLLAHFYLVQHPRNSLEIVRMHEWIPWSLELIVAYSSQRQLSPMLTFRRD